ncbi:MAG TPA: sugar transferase, partial [bacterium]|nr:sugar transferase [bacterium]
RFGLDELPQFWAVLRGEMSLVGPRPERAYFYDKYPELRCERLKVLPGITGLAQVSHRATATEADLQRKLQYDARYVREQSLWLDVRIMWRTLTLLLGGRDLI